MPTDIERASDPTTPPSDLATSPTSSRAGNLPTAIGPSCMRWPGTPRSPKSACSDLAWSCQADAVFNSATFLQLFADPGGRPPRRRHLPARPKDERPRDPELFGGFLRWLAGRNGRPDVALRRCPQRTRFASQAAGRCLVTSGPGPSRAVCRNPNAPPPDLREGRKGPSGAPADARLPGATGPFAATDSPHRDDDARHASGHRSGAHPWPHSIGPRRGTAGQNRPQFSRQAWPTFAVANGWTKHSISRRAGPC